MVVFKPELTKLSLEEKDVLDGDIYGLIAPYATANFWVNSETAYS